MNPEFTLFISVEAVEIKGSETGMEVVEVLCRFLQVETAGGSHGSQKGATNCTDTSWWKQWNFSRSQILLIPVGGSHGILAGHKMY
jgi:hypothetical protein